MNATPELSARQIKAMEALLRGAGHASAATAAGVSERTLFRFVALPHFAAELRRRRTRVLDHVATVLAAGAAGCAQVLVATAIGAIKSDAVRTSAARAVLELGMKAEEASTIDLRISELEDQVDRQRRQTTPARFS